eukprot:UN25205
MKYILVYKMEFYLKVILQIK